MWPFRFTMHRKRGLRMLIVSLLSSSPKNGVEIMDGVETMTRGWWRPTPGSIYPILTKMTEEGTLRRMEDGRYELTPKARKELESSFGPRFRKDRTTSEMVDDLQNLVSYLEDVKQLSDGGLQAHAGQLRSLAKRLSDLAKEGDAASAQQP
jgi:DNA-binding PadR family transcriptional regulator